MGIIAGIEYIDMPVPAASGWFVWWIAWISLF